MAFTEDATIYYNSDCPDHATIAGVSNTVYGFLDRVEVDYGDLSGMRPVFSCSTAAVSDVEIGASVSISTETATFRVVQNVKVDRIDSKLILET